MADRLTMDALVLAKVETTSGVDASPVAATDAVRIYDLFDPKVDWLYKTPKDHVLRGTARNARPPLPPSGRIGPWGLKVLGRGTKDGLAYAAGNLPGGSAFDALMQACGLSSTVDTTPSAEKTTYALAATGLKTITVYDYSGGKLRKLLGAVADLALSWKVGGPVEFDFTVRGLYQTPTDTSTPGSPAFGTSLEPIVDGATVSFAGQAALVVREFGLTLGNTIVDRSSAIKGGGLDYPRVTYAKPTWRLVIEDPAVAALDLETLQKNATLNALSWTVGAVNYNKIQMTSAGAVIESYDVGNENGIPTATLSGTLADSTETANDGLVLVFPK